MPVTPDTTMLSASPVAAKPVLGGPPSVIDRKSVGNANSLTINWTSRRQVGANRRAVQKSVVNQTSMSATIRSILSQGGKILSIAKA